ncbi:hypothetical protein NL108_015457 [Boleophthalmus pectinirostris]|nr:hypothetical protein NL108_015457 [Boleophthalmus pectinirostris]
MDLLLSYIGPELSRQCTNYRAAIEPKRLAVALRYLASGDSLVTLAFAYRLGPSAVQNSVHMVGDYGRDSDGGIYARSALRRGMAQKTLQVPSNGPLPNAAHLGNLPVVMVGDAAIPLKPYLLRPYPAQNLTRPERIFNYRLSRARMVVENTFGILASRWRILYRKINLHPDKVDNLVVAACILHNFLNNPNENQRLLDEQVGRMRGIRNMAGNRASREAFGVREMYCGYFNSPQGSVSWQDRMD